MRPTKNSTADNPLGSTTSPAEEPGEQPLYGTYGCKRESVGQREEDGIAIEAAAELQHDRRRDPGKQHGTSGH